MKNSNMLVLDGDAIMRVAQKLREVLSGESLPVVMQALALIITTSTEKTPGAAEARIISTTGNGKES